MERILAYRSSSRDMFNDVRGVNTKPSKYIEIRPSVFFEDRAIMLSKYLGPIGGRLLQKESADVQTEMAGVCRERQATFVFRNGLLLFSDFSHGTSCDCFYTGIEYLGRLQISFNGEDQAQLEDIVSFCGIIFPLTEDTKFLEWLPPEYKREVYL